MSEIRNLSQRMISVMDQAQKIPKNGYNSYSKYKYVRAADVVNEVSKLLVKNDISISVREDDLKREQIGKNFHSTIRCIAKFTNADDQNDFTEVSYYSVSSDTLDKDIFKAKTNGLKYLFTQMFLIVTDDVIDTEEDRSSHKPPAQTTQKTKQDGQNKLVNKKNEVLGGILKLLKEQAKGFSEDEKKEYLKEYLGVETFKEIMEQDQVNLEKSLAILENRKHMNSNKETTNA